MTQSHQYTLTLQWTGQTRGYQSYSRNFVISADGKADLLGSSDPNFQGDASRWNPEELLVASLSACHKLWFLHLAAEAGVVVTGYHDAPLGTMSMAPDGGGAFSSVALSPAVATEKPVAATVLSELHTSAHALCFIARSVNFPVVVTPRQPG